MPKLGPCVFAILFSVWLHWSSAILHRFVELRTGIWQELLCRAAFLITLLVLPSARAKPARGVDLSANVQFVPAFVALESGYNFVKEALNPVPTNKGVELMAHWQSVALNVQPKRPVREYMDLRLVNEVVAELGKK